jgi:hypothetical protein
MSAPFAQAPGRGFRIITADERQAEPRGVKACIFGGSGQGKTSLLWTLLASTTLFMDLEAGDLAVEGSWRPIMACNRGSVPRELQPRAAFRSVIVAISVIGSIGDGVKPQAW